MAWAIALTPVLCIKKEPLHPIIEKVDSFAKSDANRIHSNNLQ